MQVGKTRARARAHTQCSAVQCKGGGDARCAMRDALYNEVEIFKDGMVYVLFTSCVYIRALCTLIFAYFCGFGYTYLYCATYYIRIRTVPHQTYTYVHICVDVKCR